jgi:hypothetical protein
MAGPASTTSNSTPSARGAAGSLEKGKGMKSPEPPIPLPLIKQVALYLADMVRAGHPDEWHNEAKDIIAIVNQHLTPDRDGLIEKLRKIAGGHDESVYTVPFDKACDVIRQHAEKQSSPHYIAKHYKPCDDYRVYQVGDYRNPVQIRRTMEEAEKDAKELNDRFCKPGTCTSGDLKAEKLGQEAVWLEQKYALNAAMKGYRSESSVMGRVYTAKGHEADPSVVVPTSDAGPPRQTACSEIPAILEYFCDRSYYDQWAVREKGETRWGHCFHVPSLEEAKGLATILNAKSPEPVLRLVDLRDELDVLASASLEGQGVAGRLQAIITKIDEGKYVG